jgi:hypothetical protein
MNDANGIEIRKIVTESQKSFILKCVSFENGLFILVAEGIDRIGSLAVSIAASNKSNTATVIPSKYHSVFINTISEKVSLMINGICIVSLYSTNQLNLEDMKAIMGEIMNVVGGKHIGDDRKTQIKRRRW